MKRFNKDSQQNSDYIPLSRKQVEEMEKGDALKKVASFYEKPEKALELILGSYDEQYWFVNYVNFFMSQQEAYMKRVVHQVPHNLNLLEIELETSYEKKEPGGRRVRPHPTLDQRDRIRSEPIWVYNPKKK